jgi:L,D-transpeptidase catalytic domain
MSRRLGPVLVLTALMVVPTSALAAAPKPQPARPPEATVKIELANLDGGKARILSTVRVSGTVSPFAPNQKVAVTFYLNGKPIKHARVKVGRGMGDSGAFNARIKVRDAGRYAVSARHAPTALLGGDSTVRKSWRVSFPSLGEGKCGPVVVAFKKSMREMGYVANDGRCFGGKTARGVLAYRKVNGMTRSFRAGRGLVKRAFAGRGKYEVRHAGAGRHVEVPLGKQVLVFAKGDEPYAIYPVSSGKSSTPTVTCHFEFIRTEPGYNSHGMYYSFYFYGGYAVHGYESVPDYPASHGCIRTFIADQPEIYNRIEFGEDIFIF